MKNLKKIFFATILASSSIQSSDINNITDDSTGIILQYANKPDTN